MNKTTIQLREKKNQTVFSKLLTYLRNIIKTQLSCFNVPDATNVSLNDKNAKFFSKD